MPFPQQAPRAYTQAGIEWLNPSQNGVYGILRGEVWVYVGRGDLRTRLLAHFNGDNPRITKEKPDRYVTLLTNDDENKEKQLILEYNPIANRKVG